MIQDGNDTCIPMGLKPIPYGWWVNSKLGSYLAQGNVRKSVELETVKSWGAEELQMQRGEGHQTLYQTDKAIYLASQLSSMQLLSAK